MRVTVHKNRITRALGFVERITSRNTTLPILSNILFQTEAGRLRVSATNLEIGVSCIIGASIESEGKVAVPGKTLSDFIRNIPSETVLFEVNRNTLYITAGLYKTTILCFDATEYPIIPKIEQHQQYKIEAEVFTQLLYTVLDSIANSDSRPELAGAFLQITHSEIRIAATDIFRLAEQKIKAVNEKMCSVIIPHGTVLELHRIVSGLSGVITLQISENQILFSHEEFELVSRLIDGQYPEYQKVIPDKSLVRVLVQKNSLEQAVKTASLFSSSISDIKLECASNEIRVLGKNSSKGEAIVGVEAVVKGDPFEVSMNYHYLLDGLKIIPTDKVVLEFTGKGTPFVLHPHSDDQLGITYLIMPLRN